MHLSCAERLGASFVLKSIKVGGLENTTTNQRGIFVAYNVYKRQLNSLPIVLLYH